MIPAVNYYDSEIFKKEIAELFDKSFQFAGLTSELANDRDFVCVELYGTSVVIQNFRGKIRAFQNICSHRFNKIQTADKGNRPLMCSYHGWTYNEHGQPAGIPKKSNFHLDSPGDQEMLCLTEYPVEVCGIFVFFKRKENEASLREFLGSYYEELERIGASIGRELNFGHMVHEANWKLLVENVLECYHCASVHKDTFLDKAGIGIAKLEEVNFDVDNSSCHFPRVPLKTENLRKKLLSHLDERQLKHNSFYHIYIFPNLFIASSEGISFYIGHALPVSAVQTNLRTRHMSLNHKIAEKKIQFNKMLEEDGLKISIDVLMEDKAILENIQKTLPLVKKGGIIGDEEIRIKNFMESYTKVMYQDANPSAI